ncbi:MAG TPA: hypothetical protein VGM19_03840 [Armatimonadota bacterium]|jgi:hypothetical protein
MIDAGLTGSYLRDLHWTATSAAENERAIQRRFVEVKERSFFRQIVTGELATVEVGLRPEGDHLLVWYQVLALDGPWPGGECQLNSLQLVFDPGTLGGQLEVEMLPGELHGFGAWRRHWGLGFPPGMLCRRFPLREGEYEVSLRLRGLCRGKAVPEEVLPVGGVTVPPGYLWTGYGAANDLLVRWAEVDTYAAHPAPPAAPQGNVPAWMEPMFRELDAAAEHIQQWHFCPNTTENWYFRRTPAEGYLWNERYLGFYLNAFVPAYLLTGKPLYFQMAEYLYNTILNNIVPAFWGGPALSQSGADTGHNLLHQGILARAVLRLARALQNPELARPLYEIFAAWPRDRNTEEHRFINVVFPDKTEQRQPFVYNQVMSSVAAIWALGDMFGDRNLTGTAETMWYKYMAPGFREPGYWFYTEDAQVVTQHYDLVMKSDASLWMEYPRWAQDEDFAEIMRRSVDFSLAMYAAPVGDMLSWQPFYSGKFESSLALGKAGMALEIMQRMYAGAGLTRYGEPASKTARFIETMYRTARDTEGMWKSSWYACHVLAPLCEAALVGMLK